MHSQLACVPTTRDSAFAYGYGAGILKLRTLLLTDPTTILTALDRDLFYREIAACRHADTFGWVEMPDAFIGMTLLLLPNEDYAPSP